MGKRSVDVLVAGGGAAGIAAAVTAARAGAKTLLVERRAALGGMLSAALVHTLCGLYRLRADASEPLDFANPGFPREFAERLIARGAAESPVRMGNLDFLPHRPAGLAQAADDLLSAEPHLDVWHHAEVCSVEKDGDAIAAARIFCRGRHEEIQVRCIVDATGDAEVAALAGARFECAPPDRLQRPAVIFGLGGVKQDAVSGDARLRIAHAIASGVATGALPRSALGTSFRAGAGGEIWASVDLEAHPYDPLSPECLTRIEREGRVLMDKLVSYLRKSAPGFEQVFVAKIPAQAGIRESRRICGLATLTETDILKGHADDTAVAFTAWPLELRENARGPRFVFPEGNRSAGIPLGALISRDISNLLVAGRCISSTHEAQASIRVAGTCLATGEAAGREAARRANENAI
jgi:hypothetical protein